MPLPDVSTLTLEEKIGQMLCLGWGGDGALLAVNEQARRCVGDLHAGGMILMGRNVQSQTRPLPPINAAAVRDMVGELQSLASVPLLIPTDQEGGRVARFGSPPFTRMPSALAVAQRNSTLRARLAASATARELAAVGVNWNFAPVADVNSNPDNPVIGDRAFGTTPLAVIPFVMAQIAGYAGGGVLSCAKHFPGHGDTSQDSHFALPSLPFDLADMEQRELIPFKMAVAAGVPSIMTAHILFPAVDNSGLPATMSRAILTGLLREKMGFTGLIVTDCLEMKAVADNWGTARAAVLAAQAGADMLLVCHTWEKQRETFDALLRAAQTGELPIERVNDAVSRVFAAKAKVVDRKPPPLSVIGCEKHQAVLAEFGVAATPATVPTTLGAEAPV